MSAHAAIAPADEAPSPRANLRRMVVVAVVYIAIVVAAAVYPLVSPVAAFRPVTVADQIVGLIEAGLWLISPAGEHGARAHGRLWKLIFVWVALTAVVALTYVPDSLVWTSRARSRSLPYRSSSSSCWHSPRAPPGPVRPARRGLAYTFGSRGAPATSPRRGRCSVRVRSHGCVRNVFVIWPTGSSTIGSEPIAVASPGRRSLRPRRPLAALARRRAPPVAERSCRSSSAVPVLAVFAILDARQPRARIPAGHRLLRQPVRGAVRLIVPTDPAARAVAGDHPRPLGAAAGSPSLVVELGRGVPVGGLRDVLARALGDPSLELAFAAPSGVGFRRRASASRRAPSRRPVAYGHPARTRGRAPRRPRPRPGDRR